MSVNYRSWFAGHAFVDRTTQCFTGNKKRGQITSFTAICGAHPNTHCFRSSSVNAGNWPRFALTWTVP